MPDEIPDTPAPDPELQAWLANLFDASENEDIELKRSESEIVALRAQEPGAGSTKAEAGRFRSIGATASAKLQSPGPAEALPAPPSAVRDILNQQTMPHRPISRLDAAAMGDVTMRSEPIARPSALQSRGSAPEPVLEVKPRLHLGYLVAALLTLCVLLSLALGGAAWLLGYLH